MTITELEAAVLRAWPTNYASAEDEKADNATWNEVADAAKALGKPVKSIRGVLGSLVSKGLVEGGHEKANGVPGELQVLTDAGIDAVFALRAEAPAEIAEKTAKQLAKEAAAEKKREANEARLAAGPVRRTWAICATMPNASRKEMIAACVAAGINEATAGTQATKWRRANPRPATEA